jgi:penicillin-binding protein 1A
VSQFSVEILSQIHKLRASIRKKRKPPSGRGGRAQRKRHRWRGIVFKLTVAVAILWLGLAGLIYLWALTFDLERIQDLPERSAVLDRNGEFYSRLAGENRVVIPFDKISNDFVNALITREDTRFYSHRGVDPIGIARAAIRNLIFGGIRQGGSTITQQLARNSFPLGGRNYGRKLIEAALAFRIETELTKEQILEAYMNRIYFGAGCYGIETASRTYFGKPAARLTLSEAALMAGLIRSPSRLNPITDYAGAMKQRNIVLNRMHETGIIDADRLESALAEKVDVMKKNQPSYQQNWAMETLERELDLVLDREQITGGGLQISTTIDPAIQSSAESSLKRRLAAIEDRPDYPHPKMSAPTSASALATPYLQGAVVVLDNRTGGIAAIVGGRDYKDSRFNRAIHARRQVGSTAKPFIFARAFENGIRPNDKISDARLATAELPRGIKPYDPVNADGKYNPSITVSEALIRSRNPASVRIGLRLGLMDLSNLLTRAGIANEADPLPSLALGAFEATLKELTSAFTAFATGGVRLQPYLIAEIKDSEGRVLYKSTRGRIQFLKPEAANATADVLADVMTSGTAARSKALGYKKWGAGKTGTTNDSLDAWFVGFHSSLTCGVWVGFDQPRSIYKDAYGADLALPVWVDIMQSASSKDYPDR